MAVNKEVNIKMNTPLDDDATNVLPEMIVREHDGCNDDECVVHATGGIISRAADDDDDNNSAKTTMQSPELQLASFHSWHVILNNVSLVAIFIIQSG